MSQADVTADETVLRLSIGAKNMPALRPLSNHMAELESPDAAAVVRTRACTYWPIPAKTPEVLAAIKGCKTSRPDCVAFFPRTSRPRLVARTAAVRMNRALGFFQRVL